ncbi:MAG: aminotransferase class V-fold PLP-dependent enzyme [Anaerolineae bacterium]
MNVYEELGLETVINAAGTLTKLGGSVMPTEVVQAMVDASHDFVDMGELHLAAGRRIAELTGVEAAHICAGATAGIALMAAACMTGTDREKVDRLPDTSGMPDRFLVQRSHRQPYERAIRFAGGKMVEVASDASELESALAGEGVAGIFYTFAWFLREEALPLVEVADLAHERGVPVIVDAAAEVPPVENLWRFVKEGADLVAFSGGKAMRGPQSTGLVLGRADLVEACRLNDNPFDAVGRSMKVCKEEIAGLLKAVEIYVRQDQQRQSLIWDQRVARMIETLAGVPGLQAVRQLPYGVGQQIPHVALRWEQDALSMSCQELVESLRAGKPRIAVQLVPITHYGGIVFGHNEIRVHPHTLREGEEVVVAERIRALLSRE